MIRVRARNETPRLPRFFRLALAAAVAAALCACGHKAPAAKPGAGKTEAPSKSAKIEVPETKIKGASAAEPPVKSVPLDPFIPSGGEALRLPEDWAIGPLGPGDADKGAYQAALAAAGAAASGGKLIDLYAPRGALVPGAEKPAAAETATAAEKSPATEKSAAPSGAPSGAPRPATLESEAAAVAGAVALFPEPPRFRLGNPLSEPSGAVSFLVRFLGSGSSASGELRLVRSGSAWSLESFVLEIPRQNGEKPDLDPLSYKRFL